MVSCENRSVAKLTNDEAFRAINAAIDHPTIPQKAELLWGEVDSGDSFVGKTVVGELKFTDADFETLDRQLRDFSRPEGGTDYFGSDLDVQRGLTTDVTYSITVKANRLIAYFFIKREKKSLGFRICFL